MLLASSLEPTGPKSSNHYLILHHNDRRELVRLPKAYSDLEKEVQKLYHLPADQFYVESKELNICAGERIKIPRDAWSDLAELLGNVYIVQREIDPSPESHPEPEKSSNTRGAETEQLYRQILTCNAQDAKHVSETLEKVRNETTSSGLPTTGIKWHGQTFPHKSWTGLIWHGWYNNPRSICTVRFTLPGTTYDHFHIIFGPTSSYSLWTHLNPDQKANFTVRHKDGSATDVMRHTADLMHSVHSAGEHTLAFIKEGDKLRVTFDFRESVVLPELALSTIMERKPKDMWIGLDAKCTIAVDVYEFD